MLQGPGIWQHVKDQMTRDNKAHLYNKGNVKAAVYTSFFGGGIKAVVNSLLLDQQKKRLLTGPEWLKHPDYETEEAKAREFGQYMNTTDVLVLFRDISQKL
jgi:hypothetical protein